MSPPDDTPLAARLARWAEWWFTPRWRALLTWVLLAALAHCFDMVKGWSGDSSLTSDVAFAPVEFAFRHWERIGLPPLPAAMRSAAFLSNLFLLQFWFEPLVFRLTLLRALIWLGLRSFAWLMLAIVDPRESLPFFAWATLAWSALMVPVLYGCRSRPWMSVVGGAVMAGTEYVWYKIYYGAVGAWQPLMSLPYAVLLLYGTRLLRPEERARGTPAQLTAPSRTALPSHRGES